MRAEAKERGVIETGFKQAEDGWHIVKFDEGIDYLKNKDGEILTTKAGDNKWKFPMIVDDPNDESNEVKIDFITQENQRGENMVASYLLACGLLASFEKAFPGDVSLFEPKVIDKIKVKLPGQIVRVKTKQNTYKDKNGDEKVAVNIVGFGKMSDSVEKLEAELFPNSKGGAKTGSAKQEAAKEAPATEDEDF